MDAMVAMDAMDAWGVNTTQCLECTIECSAWWTTPTPCCALFACTVHACILTNDMRPAIHTTGIKIRAGELPCLASKMILFPPSFSFSLTLSPSRPLVRSSSRPLSRARSSPPSFLCLPAAPCRHQLIACYLMFAVRVDIRAYIAARSNNCTRSPPPDELGWIWRHHAAGTYYANTIAVVMPR